MAVGARLERPKLVWTTTPVALITGGSSGIGLELLLLACAGSSALLGRKTGLFFVSLGGLAMVIIGSTVEIDGKGAGLLVSLAEKGEGFS